MSGYRRRVGTRRACSWLVAIGSGHGCKCYEPMRRSIRCYLENEGVCSSEFDWGCVSFPLRRFATMAWMTGRGRIAIVVMSYFATLTPDLPRAG